MFNSDLDLLIKVFGKTAMKEMFDKYSIDDNHRSTSNNNSYNTSNHKTSINTSVELKNCKNVNVYINNHIYHK